VCNPEIIPTPNPAIAPPPHQPHHPTLGTVHPEVPAPPAPTARRAAPTARGHAAARVADGAHAAEAPTVDGDDPSHVPQSAGHGILAHGARGGGPRRGDGRSRGLGAPARHPLVDGALGGRRLLLLLRSRHRARAARVVGAGARSGGHARAKGVRLHNGRDARIRSHRRGGAATRDLVLATASNHLSYRTADGTVPVLAISIVGQQMPRRITLRTALVFAMRDVLPQIFHHGAMRRDRTDGAALFAVGTFPGVVEEDEETVLGQLHGGGAGEDVADYFHYIFGGTVGCTVPHSVLGRRASLYFCWKFDESKSQMEPFNRCIHCASRYSYHFVIVGVLKLQLYDICNV